MRTLGLALLVLGLPLGLGACPQKYDRPEVETPAGCPDPPSATNQLGVDGAVEVVEVARDGRWVILSQAREDDNGDGAVDARDTWSPAIVVRSGAGVGFDRLLAVSADQRWVAVMRGDVYALIDTRAPSITEIGQTSLGGAAAFTAAGALVRAEGEELVVRDLETGDEQRVEVGGSIELLDADPVGAWVRAALSTPGEVAWVDVATSEVLREPALIRPIGTHKLHRSETGVTLDGAPIGGSWCATSFVAAALAEPLTVLLVCEHGGQRLHLAIADADVALAPQMGQSLAAPAPPPLVDAPHCLRSEAGTTYCANLADGGVASAEGELLLQDGRAALFAQGSTVVAVDLVTGAAREVTDAPAWTRRPGAGPILVVDGMAIDAVTAEVKSTGPADTVVGGDGRGRLLVATSAEPRGPLRWK